MAAASMHRRRFLFGQFPTLWVFCICAQVPEDRLCPPIPNRFEYLCFIKRLLDEEPSSPAASSSSTSAPPAFSSSSTSTSASASLPQTPPKTVIGVDIGVGASCVYPLLGAKVIDLRSGNESLHLLVRILSLCVVCFTDGKRRMIPSVLSPTRARAVLPSSRVFRSHVVIVKAFGWRWIASDVDEASLASAKRNLEASGLEVAPPVNACAA